MESRRILRLAMIMLSLVLVGACSWSAEEPGLFGHTEPRPLPSMESSEPNEPRHNSPNRDPRPTGNPDLPVLGSWVWRSADGTDIEVRIAVHAVRRMAGATVLDWSVTPLSGPDLTTNDAVPASVDLGLSRLSEGHTNIFLVDPIGKAVYRPLTRAIRGDSDRSCLCTPIWEAQRNLRIDHTLLMQLVFPELPESLRTIDVDIRSVPIFNQVPVSPIGRVPVGLAPTDLMAAPTDSRLGLFSMAFMYPTSGQHFEIILDQVLAGTRATSVQWTIRSRTQGDGLERATRPPFAELAPPGLAYNAASASGPTVTRSDSPDAATTVRARYATTRLAAHGTVECLCSDLRHWTAMLYRADRSATVVTTLQPLRLGISTVDVEFPGLPLIESVPVSPLPDSSQRSAGTRGIDPRDTWTRAGDTPLAGWPADRWPTPLPDPAQFIDYVATVDQLVR